MFLWKLIRFKPSCCRLGHSCLIQRLHSQSIWFPVAWPKTYLIGDTTGPMRASLSFLLILLYSWTQSFLKIPSNIDPKWSKHPTRSHHNPIPVVPHCSASIEFGLGWAANCSKWRLFLEKCDFSFEILWYLTAILFKFACSSSHFCPMFHWMSQKRSWVVVPKKCSSINPLYIYIGPPNQQM